MPTDIVLIDTDWGEDDLSTGHELLAKMHELAAELGADDLSHSVDSPPAAPQYQENDDARIRLLTDAGYELLRDGLRWRYAGSAAVAEGPAHSLAFQPLREVGEDSFVDAIAATYQGTRDSWITREIEERGVRGAAEADFRDSQGMEHEPDWWELAYTVDGALAGVIMAAKNPTTAVIAYVGVVPDQRGRGLARELVRRGTERLLDRGPRRFAATATATTSAWSKRSSRSGYERFARRRTYKVELTRASAR